MIWIIVPIFVVMLLVKHSAKRNKTILGDPGFTEEDHEHIH